MTPRILVVEDDQAVAEVLRDALQDEGFSVEHAADGRSALDRARRSPPDLVILDWVLPDLSGLDVCRTMRAESDVPIIMLTAKGEEMSRVRGLELGADDYVTKPFSLAEIASRVRAQLRRRALDRSPGPRHVRALGWLRIDFDRLEVAVDGVPVSLTPSELRVLTLLSEQPGRVYRRSEIVERLWESAHVGSARTADAHIVSLRRKIEPRPDEPERIVTVRGAGYKLVAP